MAGLSTITVEMSPELLQFMEEIRQLREQVVALREQIAAMRTTTGELWPNTLATLTPTYVTTTI